MTIENKCRGGPMVLNNAKPHLRDDLQTDVSIYFCFTFFFFCSSFLSLGAECLSFPHGTIRRSSAHSSPGSSFHRVINNFGTITESIYNIKAVTRSFTMSKPCSVSMATWSQRQMPYNDIFIMPPSSYTLKGPALEQARLLWKPFPPGRGWLGSGTQTPMAGSPHSRPCRERM